MSHTEALACIRKALDKTTGDKKRVEFTLTTDFVKEELLDSLDCMVFLLELENVSGKKFPEQGDLVEAGFLKVEKLVQFLAAA